jgi:hypothetical protein
LYDDDSESMEGIMKRRSGQASKPSTAADHTLENPDVFSRAVNSVCGTLHAAIALTSWATVEPAGSSLVGQQAIITWQQSLLRLYELHSPLSFRTAARAQAENAMKRSTRTSGKTRSQKGLVYEIAGRKHGQLTMSRVLGPAHLNRQFTATYCSGEMGPIADLMCAPSEGQSITPVEEWTMANVKILAVGLQRDTGQMACMDQVAGHFAGLAIRKRR